MRSSQLTISRPSPPDELSCLGIVLLLKSRNLSQQTFAGRRLKREVPGPGRVDPRGESVCSWQLTKKPRLNMGYAVDRRTGLGRLRLESVTPRMSRAKA